MRWAITILICIVLGFSGLIAVTQAVDRAYPRFSKVPISMHPPFELVVTRYQRLPFFLSGRGWSPGEVAVIDAKGRVLDSEQLQNVLSIGGIVWDDSDVKFTHVDNGKVYETTFDLVR